MTKRFIAMLLCLAMLMSVQGPAVYAAGETDIYIDNTAVITSETEPLHEEPATEAETVVTEPVVETETEYTEPVCSELEITENETYPAYETESVETVSAVKEATSHAVGTVTPLTPIEKDKPVYQVTATVPYPTICWGNDVNEDGGTNGAEDWTLTTSRTDSSIDNSHTENYDIRIDGTGAADKTFYIVLQHPNEASTTKQTLYLDLHTIWVKGGANLVIRLGGTINNTNTDKIVITQVPGRKNDNSGDDWWLGELFWIEDGSLELRPSYDNQSDVRIQIDVQSDALNSTTYGSARALVSLRSGADYLKLDQVDFLNCHTSAIVCRADKLSEFTMTDCSFASGCYSTGNAGAIYVRETVEDTSTSTVDITTMTLTNVEFNGNYASGNGGAITIRGNVNKLLFDGCSFTDTKAGTHGGAIQIGNGDSAVTIGSVEFKGCTFKNTIISNTDGSGRGGAIRMVANCGPFTIDDCDFTDCIAGSHGGAISLQGTVGDFTIRNGSTFTNCSASARGGAVGVNCSSVGDITLSGSSFDGNTAGTLGGSVHFGLAGGTTPITAGDVSIVDCSFMNSTATGVGGGVALTDGTYSSVSVQNTTFENCQTIGFGGAIGLKVYKESEADVMPFSVTGAVEFVGCTFTGCISGDLALEPYDYDGDGVAEETWDHDNDPSTAEIARLNGSAGGGAIAIGGPIGGTITIKGTDENNYSKFTDCATWNNGGAIAFLSRLTTPKVVLQYLDIDGCRARDAGNAIHLSDVIIDFLDMQYCTIQNCKYFTEDYVIDIPGTNYDSLGTAAYVSFDASGTFRVIGNTTCAAEIKNCQFLRNESYSNGGGVYWNSNKVQTGVGGTTVAPSLKLVETVFDGNYAVRDGGGLYCEATIDVDKCEFKNNSVGGRGGGIAQQVYSNEARKLGETEGEATNLILDEDTSIHDNTAVHGGGISITVSDTVSVADGENVIYPVKFTLGGAKVYNNKASQNGGGIYYATAHYDNAVKQRKVDNFQKEILIDNGEIHDNIAGYGAANTASAVGGNGGGIYMSSNQVNTGDGTGYSKMRITSGSIYCNTATNGNGGGIYLTGKNAECIVTGGTIGGTSDDAEKPYKFANIAVKNPAHSYLNQSSGCGGGIAIAGGAHIDMVVEEGETVGGTVSFNKAGFQGAGIWLAPIGGKVADGYVHNSISVSAGLIQKNLVTATTATCANGGGVFIGESGEVTISGGEISNNSTLGWGGGIFADFGVTVTVTGGSVTDNTANCGGGIGMQKSGTLVFSGGNISNNEAEAHGGGVFANSTCTVTFSGGEISGNTAGNRGGGAYGSSSSITVTNGNVSKNYAQYGAGIAAVGGSTFNINGGTVASNGYKEAPADDADAIVCYEGGGVYAEASTVNLNGGFTSWNEAVDGGGIAAVAKSTVTTTKGGVSGNLASRNGGGIFCKEESTVTVGGGIINENEAANAGGGIYAIDRVTVSIVGGNVTENTALSGGGIYAQGNWTYDENNQPVYDTKVTLVGGSVSKNTATGTGTYDGQGGGILADRFVEVIVKKSEDGKTVGKITENTASKGGGVYVCSGAKLSVIDGHITYNNAVGTPSDVATTYHDNHGLLGVGGGIYVADGYSAAEKSQFTLSGTDIAIYGNLADFAADDVFANGNNTQLNVPEVQNMNLSGHSFKPEGWVEDYNVADTMYESGTEAVLMNDVFDNGVNDGIYNSRENVRYRGSAANKRIVIPDVKVAAAVNAANAYVCMTLGVPTAVPDTIVIDFGLSVVIDVLENDMMTKDVKSLAGIYNNKMIEVGGLGYTENLDANYGRTELTCGYGKISVSGDNILYTPNSMNMVKEDVFSYAVNYGNYYYYADVTVVPATIIYYEDSFGTVTYSAYSYVEGTTGQTTTIENAWQSVGTAGTANQDADRPGTLNKDDADNIYGTDSAYETMQNYSMGSSMKFTAKQNGTTKTVGMAEFTFTGTGFDIISMSSNTTGTIFAAIYKTEDLASVTTRPIPSTVKPVDTVVVDTYYGYKYDAATKTWSPAPNSSDTSGTTETNALYQVPVIKKSGLTYGKYTVILTVTYSYIFDHDQYSTDQYDFYLDAIRIYDPANDGAGNSTVQNAYVDDKEGWPEYFELRNLLITKKTFDSIADTTDSVSGIVFIDNTNNTSTTEVSIADYTNFGPNNELYLAPGQAVAFNLSVSGTATADVATIQLALKSVGGTAKVKVYDAGAATIKNCLTSETISTATDLYYDITALNNKTVVIMNTGSTADDSTDAILSITNVKVTYTAAHEDGITEGFFTASGSKSRIAVQSVQYLLASEGEEDPGEGTTGTIEVKSASLSFEDEILTNLYYTISGIDATEMGLLTWAAEPAEATVDNAENVYVDAQYDAEKDRYMVQTAGIAAKNLGDDIYMCVYAKTADGIIYSDVVSYSPKQYAMSRLEKSTSDTMKALCAAMLNYGAAAQEYFGYKTDVLMNADLTDEQKALVAAYDASLFAGAVQADESKVGGFLKTEGFSKKSATVSFEGAFAINYYFTANAEVAGDVTFYYWTADAYANADVLTAENASGTATMAATEDGRYWADITGIAAKQLDETFYVAAVYTDASGNTNCTGVIAYSLSQYCVNNTDGDMGALAEATAMYGYYAAEYLK